MYVYTYIGDLSKHRHLPLSSPPPPWVLWRSLRTGAFYQKINYAATVNVILYPAVYPKAFPPRRPRDVYRITIILPQITPGRSSNPRGLNQIKTAISYLLKIRTTHVTAVLSEALWSTMHFPSTWYRGIVVRYTYINKGIIGRY